MANNDHGELREVPIMVPANPYNGRLPQILASTALLATIIGGQFMLHSVRFDALEREVSSVRHSMSQDDARERDDAAVMATFRESFREVETQFSGLKEVTDVRIKRLEDAEAMRQEQMFDLLKNATTHEHPSP